MAMKPLLIPSIRLRRWLGPTALASALAATGCATSFSGPEYPTIAATAVPPSSKGSPIQQAQFVEGSTNPEAPGAPRPALPAVVGLPEVVHESMYANLRIRARGEKVQQAMADLTTEGIIPNMQLFADYQLIPLQHVDINNQAGPPQYDMLFTIPLDWYLFGKRVAAIEAARLNVDVASFDLADFVRTTVQQSIETYYDHLEAKALLKLAQDELADLTQIESIIQKQLAAGGTKRMDADRARLAVLDAQRDVYLRELTVASTKAKLRPLLGRSVLDPDFEVQGTLEITQAARPPSLPELIALAEKNRPDLLSDQASISQSMAALHREQRKAKPQVSLQTGLSAQIQKNITGYADATLFDVGITTSLPFTDRNQGNIAKVQSQIRQNVVTWHADELDARAEIERGLREYENAFDRVTRDDAQTLKTARSLRDATREAVNAGGFRLLDLLDAQRTYRDRVRATISNQADYWRSLNRLNAATGMKAVAGE